VARRRLPFFLALGAILLAVAPWLPAPAGPLLFAAVAFASPVALMALGARSGLTGSPLPWWLLGLAAWLEGCLVAMLLLRGVSSPRILGLPPALAVLLLGVVAVPVLATALLYAHATGGAGQRGR